MCDVVLVALSMARKPPSKHTLERWERVKAEMPWHDRRAFENSRRGFIASLSDDGVRIARRDNPAFDAINTLPLVDLLSHSLRPFPSRLSFPR